MSAAAPASGPPSGPLRVAAPVRVAVHHTFLRAWPTFLSLAVLIVVAAGPRTSRRGADTGCGPVPRPRDRRDRSSDPGVPPGAAAGSVGTARAGGTSAGGTMSTDGMSTDDASTDRKSTDRTSTDGTALTSGPPTR